MRFRTATVDVPYAHLMGQVALTRRSESTGLDRLTSALSQAWICSLAGTSGPSEEEGVVDSCRIRFSSPRRIPVVFLFFAPTALWIVSIASRHPSGIRGLAAAVSPLI